MPYNARQVPEWVKSASIYQLNTRQFTPEGTLRAARQQLLRLKNMGISIIWIMPIHEIGNKNRKGTLGSPYSVKNYYSVNPELGTFEDVKQLTETAHKLGMYVILDWVANHTAWDHQLVKQHPDWYARDWKGNFRSTPWWDWTDIIELDYNNPGVWKYMIKAMGHWIKEAGFDGFRADVAGFVPIDFWVQLRRELDQIKPVFMLAEWESRELHLEAFDMTYAWSWWDAMHDLAMGRADVGKLQKYYATHESAYPTGSIRMSFVTNHDKNAWEGSMFENFGDALEAVIALSVVDDSMPLIHNGQEAGQDKALAFFEKDPIQWQPHPMGELYRQLLSLKKQNSALWNGHWGAPMIRVANDAQSAVLSFIRQNDRSKVFAIFNFSGKTQQIRFFDTLHLGLYTGYFCGKKQAFDQKTTIRLDPWAFRIYTQ